MDERELLEQEMRCIIADMTAPTSKYGDWKQIKYLELSSSRECPYTDEEMEDYHDHRKEMRSRINEIKEQLKKLEESRD